MMILSDMELTMLRLASIFLYLTHRQFRKLGVSDNLRVIARKTQRLCHIPSERRPLLGVLTYPPHAKFGRVENVYYLTEWGSKKLSQYFPEKTFPWMASPSVWFRDYYHRWLTVNAHIAITHLLQRRHPELSLVWWKQYFEKTGANRRSMPGEPLHAVTRVPLPGRDKCIVPDATFLIGKEADGSKGLLCCLEVSNGRDTRRLLSQIRKHCLVLKTMAIGEKYGLTTGHQVLFLISELGLLEAVLRRFDEIPHAKTYRHHFLFAYRHHFERCPETCWVRPFDGDQHVSFLTGKAVDYPPIYEVP